MNGIIPLFLQQVKCGFQQISDGIGLFNLKLDRLFGKEIQIVIFMLLEPVQQQLDIFFLHLFILLSQG